ncbi:MAG TPA: EamA family transporter [Candidatus Dormibacteraeota bacterium]|nr:EamA family transporter [Candidatus Dormibacteraeota bacterium]
MTPSLTQIVVAFALVYVVWGSTYLAIRVAVESLPVLLYAGVRFVVAGAVLYAAVAARGLPRVTRVHWRDAAIVGGLLLLGGNGLVSFAERTVPSGVAAVIVATVPLDMVLLDWVWRRSRPSWPLLAAIGIGLVGVALLVGAAGFTDAARVDPLGAGALIVASLSWAAGSLYSSRARTPATPILATGMQQLAGGALLLGAGAVTGELSALDPATFTARSLAALLYLIVFGSLVGFTAYIWLLRNVSPALVSTYAFVNPVVAVFLGWAILAEEITVRTVVASAIIVVAVAIITLEQARRAIGERREREAEEEPAASLAK